ncbi:hypothetical protein Heshes_14070 [Alicyclobacillus hesperidum]|uniref:TIGR00375 family protein n=1 Tax=Alicyclobacillus hesperidum TaxID=89784 RepID=A0AA37U9L3_9BACL|nr:endonuclease Q family protein [Alicyclobacillus hesperidum]GLV13723.1 hypothetical protein Heshes_14070 [Alicyclobacillus hesperidum]
MAPERPMKTYFADFHIHVGRAKDRPVKIAAGKNLTLTNLLEHSQKVKGLDIVGVIDGVCDPVLAELDELVAAGELAELPEGGLLYRDRLLVIAGAEVELKGPKGRAAHFGCWFPNLAAAHDFNAWLKTVQKNTSLSSQLARTSPFALSQETHERGGLLVIHHAFTPFKGILGAAVDRVSDFIDLGAIDALELGLSADTSMADRIEQIQPFTYLSNSDAHGLDTIARECNRVRLDHVSFAEVRRLLARQDGRKIVENIGLHPVHGKYYQTRCRRCGEIAGDGRVCSCGTDRNVVTGVSDRIDALADFDEPQHPEWRPPYRHIVPLLDIPGVGPKAYRSLVDAFGSELALLREHVAKQDVQQVVGAALGERVFQTLQGHVSFAVGGAGTYGKVLV